MSGSNSISRAFTKRQKRPEVSAPMPYHEGQTKLRPGTIRRGKISSPVTLISSTNLIAYTAPDLRQGQQTPSPSSNQSSSSSSSLRSADDSDAFFSPPHHGSTPITSPEPSSVEASPISPPEPNHLSSYFDTKSKTHTSSINSHAHTRSNTSSSLSRSRSSAASSLASKTSESPAIPQRSLTHTKKSHQELARQRSRSRMTPPPPTSLSNTHAARMSQDRKTTTTTTSTSTGYGHAQGQAQAQAERRPEPHPFGKELEQVNEVVEEFGGIHSTSAMDEEERSLLASGLKKFTVEEYISEIQDLYRMIYGDEDRKRQRAPPPPPQNAWI